MSSASQTIADEMGLDPRRVQATLDLLADGATIPFVSRYRKEATGGLDETQIFDISQRAEQLAELSRRRAYILTTIDQQGRLTDELRQAIGEATDMATLEDLYLPYKPKRRTRASAAREAGLEPLAKIIMAQNAPSLEAAATRFVTPEGAEAEHPVADAEAALQGARDIIAEWVNEDQRARNRVRETFRRSARISSKVVKSKQEQAENYRAYFNVNEPLNRCSSHRYLAMRRGEAEGLLRVSLDIDDEKMLESLNRQFVRKGASQQCADAVVTAVADGYYRLMRPSIETEIAAEAKGRADDAAIATFAENLHQLLLSAPLGSKRTMGIDPGFRTGCKVVCLDANGNLLHHDVVFPTPPRNDLGGSANKLNRLIDKFQIDAIAVGNGTASRETESFLRSMAFRRPVEIFVVSESGASIYSASQVARDEFPDQDVTVRGAVSIARRLMDPLAELVKIDPKSIGVGQYQHDVDQTKLRRQLDMTVMSCVNSVGVNVNTASVQLLSYVSGIGAVLAQNIVSYRADTGDFHTRRELLRVPRLGAKAFEQCAGFLRVPCSDNILDNTAVHPERYAVVERIAADSGHPLAELVNNLALLKEIDLARYVTPEMGLPTLTDILAELEKPGRDPREKAVEFQFDERVHEIGDLEEGMTLPGIVENITDFGVFVDIGVHTSGLIHISQMGDRRRRASHPSEYFKLHQQVAVKVLSVDMARGRISLTTRGVDQPS